MFFRKKISVLKHSLQTPHAWTRKLKNRFHLGRTSLCTLKRASLTLEAALVLPLFLCAVTAMLYLFAFSASQGKAYRTLTERAEVLAVTAGASMKTDLYIRLYDYDRVQLPFASVGFGRQHVVRKVTVRAWAGYTGESFRNGGSEELVYRTPDGEVYHRDRDCTYLKLTIRMVSSLGLADLRNQSGERYAPCEYCCRKEILSSAVYITDYGNRYHNHSTCQGLKRTVMAVPLSKVGGLRSCSRCGGSH